MSERTTDVLIVGGGVGGVAAALAVCRRGRRAILTEPTDWIGGQLTSQAVPPDEHPWVEQFGVTGSYREFREGVRSFYRQWYPLRAEAARDRRLNPGGGRVSKLCIEPRVALAVLNAMLAPHLASGRLEIRYHTVPTAVRNEGDRVASVRIQSRQSDEETWIRSVYALDASETGELLAMAEVEHVTGAEGREEYDEPHAPAIADPANMQGITYCFAVDHRPGEDHTIDRPREYGFWRGYQPEFWPGPLLGFRAPNPRTLAPTERTFQPNPDGDPLAVDADQSKLPGDLDLWMFRRILARNLHTSGMFDSDITLVNWPLNDYWLGNVIGTSEQEEQASYEGARQLSLSVLYWLQTEAPRPDGGTGWPGLRLRTDIVGTADGLAKAAYVRESRRIRARTTVTEHDVSLQIRGPYGILPRADSVGVGSYHLDLHPSTGGDNYIDLDSVPFEIPLGALIPIRVRNLLPAGKNIGTTHISNGSFRLHPVEWNIGEVAGALAAWCLDNRSEPHAVFEQQYEDFARVLDRDGVERHWPDMKGY